MSQNINLFRQDFLKKRQILTLTTVVQFLGILLAALFGYQYYLQQQVDGLNQELQDAQGLLRSQQGYVGKLKDKAAAFKGESQLESEITRYEAELKIGRDAMEALTGGTIGNRQGFAEYLRAFSRQSMNGLWLTGFTIAGTGELEIRGRTLSPELVPSYIQRLNEEKVLAGRSFSRFEMSQHRTEAGAGTGGDAKQALRTSTFLDFSLATTDAAKAEQTP